MSGRHPVAGGALSGYMPQPCRATSKASGKPCGRTAEPGATVCRYHGGAAPQVKRKAALRLLELVDPAVATLARVMASPAAKDSDKIRAAENVLDRAGVPRRVETVDTETAKAILVERLLAMQQHVLPDHTDDGLPDTVLGTLMPTPDAAPDPDPQETP